MPMTVSLLVYAEEILRDHPNGLHVNEIASSILNQHPIPSDNLGDFIKKLNGALAGAVKAKTPRFTKPTRNNKPRKGWYRLKRQKSPALAMPGDGKDVSTMNIGSGGEQAVISELLFNGFNAAKMTVDDGIDVVASKSNTFYHIQVKTSNDKGDGTGTYHFSVNRASFIRKSEANTYYIFVMRRKLFRRRIHDFVILPQKVLRHFDNSGLLKGKKEISLNFSFIGTDTFFLNKTVDVTEYVNNWKTSNW